MPGNLATSTLKLTIDAAPDDLVMKGQNVVNWLKRSSTPLTGQPLKKEEVDFAGFANLDPLKRYTKKDLQALEAARTDIHSAVINPHNEFEPYTLKEFDLTNYEEHLKTFSREGVERNVESHFPRVPNYRGHTRRTISGLDGEDGRIVFELQSDLFQGGRVAGQTFEEANELEKVYLTNAKEIAKQRKQIKGEIAALNLTLGKELDSTKRTKTIASLTDKIDNLVARGEALKEKAGKIRGKQGKNNAQLFHMIQANQDAVNSVHQATFALPSELRIENMNDSVPFDDILTTTPDSPKVIALAKELGALDNKGPTDIEEYYKRLNEPKVHAIFVKHLGSVRPSYGSKYITTGEALEEVLNSDFPGADKALTAAQNRILDKRTTEVPEVKTFLKQFDKQMDQVYGLQAQSDLEKAWNSNDPVKILDTWGKQSHYLGEGYQAAKQKYLQGDKAALDFHMAESDGSIMAAIEVEQKKRLRSLIDMDAASRYPKDTPFASNNLEKDLETELVQAQNSGLKFVAIPLEVGTTDLARGASVQKRYETAVRSKMKHMVERLNKSIDQQAIRDGNFTLIKDDKGAIQHPNVNPAEYFKYTEVKVPVQQSRGQSPTRILNGMTESELLDFNMHFNLMNPEELSNANIRQKLTDFVTTMSPARVEEVFGYKEIIKESHTLGKISLPTRQYEAFGPNQVSASRQADLKYVADKIAEMDRKLANIDENLPQYGPGGVKEDTKGFDTLVELRDYWAERRQLFKDSAQGISNEASKPISISPKWMDSLRLYSAAPAGLSAQSIHEALQDPEANAQNVEDFLVNNRGMDRTTVRKVIDKTMQLKVNDGLEHGLSTEELTSGMLARGYSLEDIERYMPKETIRQQLEEGQNDFMRAQMLSFDFIRGELNPLYNSEYEKSAEARAAMAVSANETVLKIWHDLSAPLSRELKVRAKTQSLAMNAEIMRTLSAAGIEAKVTENGEILVPDSNGTLAPLNVSTIDGLLAHKAEIINSIAGGVYGAKIGSLAPGALKGPGFIAGATIGSAIGAFTGRGIDMLRNRLYNKQELDAKFMWDEMLATGAADAVIGLVIPAGIKMTGSLAKGLYRAYDYTIGGNIEGANRALLELLHVTPEEAKKVVTQWEQVTGQQAPGRTQAQKNLAVIPRTVSDAYAVIGPASKESSRMSTNLAREIDTRAKDLISQVHSGTSDQVGTILRHEMPLYEKKVKDTFTAVKEFGKAQMKDSPYRFDFDKLAIEPIMERAIANIHNPALKQQAESYLTKVRQIGGKELADGTEINTMRSFKDLLELRAVINEFGTKRNLKNAKDIEMVVEIRKRIDSQITKAARTGMGTAEGNAWLKQWKAVNQGYKNMLDVKKNVFYKAIMKKKPSEASIAKALLESAMSIDGTYREVMQTLPQKMKAPTENAVLREIVNKFTRGEVAGKQAIDFMALSNQLTTIPFTSQGARDLKRSISMMAKVFRNDPKALAATGVVKTPSFQSYLTVDPVIRLKYEFASSMFNYVKRLSPSAKGREIALVMNVAKVLENPKNSQAIDDLIKLLPKDPALRNELRKQAMDIAKWNEKSVYPEVEVYGSAAKGYSLTPTNGPLGKGIYYYTDKSTARTTARLTGGKLGKQRVHPDRVADETVIREVLGLAEDVEVTTKLIRETPKLKQMLEDRMYNGIIVSDTVMLF